MSQVTILLPFYKEKEKLHNTINSIMNQSFSQWQLLLVANKADLKTYEIAQRWEQTDSRISMISESRQGIAHALNTGLESIDTPFVARMDADDIMMPERLETQIDYLQNHPETDVVASQTQFISEISESEGYELFVDWQNSIITHEEHCLYRFIESPIAHPTVMFRRELIENYGEYSTDNLPEDYELWLRWMDKGRKFYKLPMPLLVWNDHESRLSRNHENYSREAFFTVKCYYLARWIQRNVSPKKKIVVCGSSKIGRKRAQMLADQGVDIFGFTDVKKRPNRQVNFIPYQELSDPTEWFLINFIARRGVGDAIRNYFSAKGFREGTDFIMGA